MALKNDLIWKFRDPGELRAWGKDLASLLRRDDVVALVGDLGAGKTTLVQGIAFSWGYRRGAISPTFSLANEYQTPRGPIYHMDMYRLSSPELAAFPLQDYWGAGLCLIEWADRVRERWLPETLEIRLSHEGKKSRRLEIVGCSPRWRRRLAKISRH